MKDWKEECKQAGLGLLLGGLVFSAGARAAPAEAITASADPVAAQEAALGDPLIGMLVNQTRTVAGQEFFRSFAAGWRDMPVSQRYSVSIHERPSARQGSEVWVEFGRQKMFRAFLPPGRDQILAISEQAVAVVSESIIATAINRALFRDADLAADEI